MDPFRSFSLDKTTDKKKVRGRVSSGDAASAQQRRSSSVHHLTIAWRGMVNGNNTPNWSYSIGQSNGKIALPRANLKNAKTEGDPPGPDEPLAMF